MAEPALVTASLDPVRLERSLRRMVVERLRLYAGFGAAWGVAQLVLIRLLHPHLGPQLYLVIAGFIVGCLGTIGLLRAPARRLGSSAVSGIGVALGLFQILIHAVSVEQTGEPTYFYITTMVIVAAGALLLHHGWTVAYGVGAAAIMLTLGSVPGHRLSLDLLLFAAAITTSGLLHLVSWRYVVDIERLSQHDEGLRGALEQALADARRELADRERAEADREGLQAQLLHAQKMESIGTLAGGFAHDMNNVLGGILGGAELLREVVALDQRAEVDDLINSTLRGAELTRNLLGFARRGQYRRERVEVAALVTDLVRMLARTVPKGVSFETAIAPEIAVDNDPAQLTQALVNLCLNAVDAMRGVGRIAITASTVELAPPRTIELGVSPGLFVALAVRDDGAGMAAATAARIFEPFFTTKDVGRGTGLGLAMVYGTVTASHGAIDVASELGVGTTLTLYLPAATTARSELVPRSGRISSMGGEAVLVVDDDAKIRRSTRRILESRGYVIFEASDGAEAVRVYDEHGAAIDLVVLDMAMPVMSGAECFGALRRRDPEVRVLLASGYAIEEDARRCLREGAVGFLDKPYAVELLLSTVAKALRGHRPGPT